jgi:hypothetical protein
MADRLYLSYWMNVADAPTRWRAYGKVIERFPYSKLSKAESVLRAYEREQAEPALAERPLALPFDVAADLQPLVNEYAAIDTGCELDTFWDLWQWDGEWAVRPARVLINGFGPEFDSGGDDHVRIDFGLDSRFLPDPARPESARMIESNIKSLLHLVHDLDNALNAEKRQLWSESGENFAEKLQQSLESLSQR